MKENLSLCASKNKEEKRKKMNGESVQRHRKKPNHIAFYPIPKKSRVVTS